MNTKLFISDLEDDICLYSKVGDGICHDEFNVYECMYDGGDCCLFTVDTSECTLCYCVQPPPSITPPSIKLECEGNTLCHCSWVKH